MTTPFYDVEVLSNNLSLAYDHLHLIPLLNKRLNTFPYRSLKQNRWRKNAAANIIISENGRTLKCNQKGSGVIATTHPLVCGGVYYIEANIWYDTTTGFYPSIGIVPTLHKNGRIFEIGSCLISSGKCMQKGYSHNLKQNIPSNAVIGLLVDMIEKKLSFYVNGAKVQVELNTPDDIVYVAAGYGNYSMTLEFDKPLPSEIKNLYPG
jgi:hypothetical protein